MVPFNSLLLDGRKNSCKIFFDIAPRMACQSLVSSNSKNLVELTQVAVHVSTAGKLALFPYIMWHDCTHQLSREIFEHLSVAKMIRVSILRAALLFGHR